MKENVLVQEVKVKRYFIDIIFVSIIIHKNSAYKDFWRTTDI